jgi:hypothetical protein
MKHGEVPLVGHCEVFEHHHDGCLPVHEGGVPCVLRLADRNADGVLQEYVPNAGRLATDAITAAPTLSPPRVKLRRE